MRKLLLLSMLLFSTYCVAQTRHWTAVQSGDFLSVNPVPQSQFVYLSGTDIPLTLMDVKSGDIVEQYKREHRLPNDWWRSGIVRAVTKDNNYVLSTQFDTLLLWNTKADDSVMLSRYHFNASSFITSSGDGERVFVDTLNTPGRRELLMIETATLNDIRRFAIPNDPKDIVANSDGTMVAIRSESNFNRVSIYSTETGAVIQTITIDPQLSSLRFSNDGSMLICMHPGRVVKYTISNMVKNTYLLPAEYIITALSPDENEVAILDGVGIVLYNLTSKSIDTLFTKIANIPDNLPPIQYSGDGSSLLIGRNNVVVVNKLTRNTTHTLSISDPQSLRLFSNDKFLLLNSSDVNIIVDAINGQFRFYGADAPIALSRKSSIIVVVSDGSLTAIDIDNDSRREVAIDSKQVTGVVSDDGTRVAFAIDSSTMVVYDLKNMKEVQRIVIPMTPDMKIERLQYLNNDSLIGVVVNDGYSLISTDSYKIIKSSRSGNFEYDIFFSYPREYFSPDGAYILYEGSNGLELRSTSTSTSRTIWFDKAHPNHSIQSIKWIDENRLAIMMDARNSNADTLFIINTEGTYLAKNYIPTLNEGLRYGFELDCSLKSDSLSIYLATTPRVLQAYSARLNTTSVDEIDTEKYGITLFPNPTSEYVKVRIGKEHGLYCTNATIYSVLGNVVSKTVQINSEDFTIPTKQMNNGVYVLYLTLSNNETVLYRFIIQH